MHLYYAIFTMHLYMCICANQKCDFQKKKLSDIKKSGPESRHVGHVNSTVIGDSTKGYIFITNFLHKQ